MYMCRSTDMTNKFNEFGKNSFACHYHGNTAKDFDHFLQNVVVNGDDSMRDDRERFFNEYLCPKDGVLPSRKILEIIEQFIKGTVV